MITKGFILVEGQNIKDLVRAYNRDSARIDSVAKRLACDRIKALRQGRIKKEGFDVIYATVKSEKGNWDYNLVLKVVPQDFKYYLYTFTIIDDPVRPKKREIILWETMIKDGEGDTKCPMIIKQHALERYYQRQLGEEFPGIKEASRYIVANELIIENQVNDLAMSSGVVQDRDVSLAVRSGQFLAYTKEEGRFDKTKPMIFNTFVSHREIEEGQRSNQIMNRNLQEKIAK